MALPQFARNYGRSGAYENPQTVVDTKTGAIWGNAIQNIGNSIASTIEGISKAASLEVQRTQKILDENARFIQENYSDFLKQAGSTNESFNNLALDIIRKKGEAYMGMRKGDQQASKDFASYSSKLNKMINLAEARKNAAESYTNDFVDNYANVNTPGGVSTVGIDPVRSMNYQLAMPALLRGTKNGEENWYLDNDLNIRTRYTSDQISKNFKEGNIKNDYIDADPLDIYTFDAGVVEDVRKETLKFFNQAGVVKNNVLGDGFIQNTIETIQSGDVEYDYQKIDMAKVTGSTKDFINAKAKTYLKRPSAANNLWNHQLQQGRNIIDPKTGKQKYPDGFKLKLADGQIGTTFDTETSKVFTESLAQYMYDILPEGKQGSVRKITKEKPSASLESKKVDVTNIDELTIPFLDTPGPATEEGGLPRRPVDIIALEGNINKLGFNIVGDPEKIGDVTTMVVTKSTEGRTTGPRVTLRSDMTGSEIKRLLKQVETGELPPEEVDPFLQYQTN